MTPPPSASPGLLMLEPGDRVRHPERPDWGLGQVQSVAAGRVTVNFEHAGKRVIIASRIALLREAENN